MTKPDLSTWLTEAETASRLGRKRSNRAAHIAEAQQDRERKTRPVPKGEDRSHATGPKTLKRTRPERPFIPTNGNGQQLQTLGAQALHPSLRQALVLFREIAGPAFAQLETMAATFNQKPAGGATGRRLSDLSRGC